MKPKILIVEDSPINQRILEKILQQKYDIEKAFNGKEALSKIQEKYEVYSAVILDLRMPEMNGDELLEILSKQKLYSNLPILVATGENDQKMESYCLKLGAWDFVSKPYNPEIIHLRLNNIIGRSRVSLMDKIKNLSERDYLTNLYNRPFFMQKTKEIVNYNQDKQYILVRIDIDNFRLYNSSFGGEAGDKLIQHMAETLNKRKEDYRIIGRIESDVFCICTIYDREVLKRNMTEVAKEMQEYCSNYRLNLSFGLYIIKDTNEDMEKMYSYATLAARKCKSNVNLPYVYYDEEMSREGEITRQLTGEMEHAIAEKQFKVFLQPKYSMETNTPCGAEALVRWIHPEKGMISPADFIPLFEQNGQILELDYYMWENVCILLRKWMDEGRTLYPISVNVSRISMYNPKIVKDIERLTDKYSIPRHLLQLEITESAYMSNPEIMGDLTTQLRQKGFVLLMDDFGSGYSSLNTLKDIDLDILKIDMKFLPTGTQNVKSEKILTSIVRMAGWLGMPVVVEGVETKKQKDFLDSIGCSFVQGFYFARPMPVDEYEALITKSECVELNDVENNNENFEAIWSSQSQVISILKSVQVPYAIFEYFNGEVVVLRSNQAYITEFGNSASLNNLLEHKERLKIISSLDGVVQSKTSAECESLFTMPDGNRRWYQIRLMYIGTAAKSSLIGATIINVTEERNLEIKLNNVFNTLNEQRNEKSFLLVIDDQIESREIIKLTFEDDFDILEASDGEEALDILSEKKNSIAAILLDLMMPNLSGHEFLSYKNKMSGVSEIPIIVISSEQNEKLQIGMLQDGVADYVTKPFVPQLLHKRLYNVLEYHSRFKRLVQEFKSVTNQDFIQAERINLEGFSVLSIREMIAFMGDIFDVVRMVDPDETAVITLNHDGSITKEKYSCYKIWEKDERCENCSSQCAKKGHCVLSKYEQLKDNVFYVVSKPISIVIGTGERMELVLEIASKIASDSTWKILKDISLEKVMEDTKKMIYTDPLTQAFNRRYYDEMLFMNKEERNNSTRVGVVMLDLYRFKRINDIFGHQTGDYVLTKVSEILRAQIRAQDSVIRYGGDEFIIIFIDCDEIHVKQAISRLSDALGQIAFGPNNNKYVEADFGYSFTENFDRNLLKAMLQEADEKMYANKNKRKKTFLF